MNQCDEFCSGFNMLKLNVTEEKQLAFIISGDFKSISKNWWLNILLTAKGLSFALLNLPLVVTKK